MYYFAYGTNLNKKQMLERCPESRPVFTAVLPNYKLIFVGWSRQWRGGIASIKSLRGEKVAGAIYELSDRDLRRLDKNEGYPGACDKIKVTVYNEDGDPIEAVTYMKFGKEEETKPSREYFSAIQHGYRDWGIV